MRSYVLWLLTAVGLLAVATQAAHVRQATSGSSSSSSSLVSSYANDPRPDAVDEQASDILGTGGAYEFRLPQPQISKQQQQQVKTKRPNTNITYITTTKTSSSSSGIGGVTKSSSTKRPATSTTIATGGHKASVVTSNSHLPTPTAQGSTQLPGLAYNITVTPQQTQASYQPATLAGANDEPAVTTSNAVNDDESSKKVIGSSVVTSVSVILNGDEPEFTDALGHKVPKPQPSLQVASPIDLLNPDRYEFYTFDENGELVKRLMTMEEIQSIVANGDGENSSIVQHVPVGDREPEKNVQDIVDSVQDVLNKEVESNKNISKDALPVLDTPDVSSSWSMIYQRYSVTAVVISSHNRSHNRLS
ncbi:unnamed protein product [Ceratitis capitata]|uniref:(Mediterranean fruit fly) hypothetical protein n=1 Tax=Ceratitis capitata TaxID=7213 RepID=A0A811VAH7_CERCA|nr:unnamed protein product [Ceratitis capitata]